MEAETRAAARFDALGLAEGGMLADVGIVLDLATIYLPLIGTVLAPTVPTPFAVLMLRRGPKVTLLAAAVASFLVGVLSGPHFGWRMGLEAALPATHSVDDATWCRTRQYSCAALPASLPCRSRSAES